MSVYKPAGKPFYLYDFQIGGHRFHGSTRQAERGAARTVEKQERARAERTLQRARETAQAFRGEAPLTLDAAAGRWWVEVGEKLAASGTQWRNLENLIAYFGARTHLSDISDEWVARWVRERSNDLAWNRIESKTGTVKRVAAATVNRTTVDMLRKIFTRARKVWKIALPSEPDWKQHRQAEPKPKIHILDASSAADLQASVPEGYRDVAQFSLVSGLRLAECFLRWSQIAWPDPATGRGGTITVIQKGGRPHVIPLSREMIAVIAPQRGRHPEWVFTAPRRRRSAGTQTLGERFPVTYDGMKSAWRRAKAGTATPDIRFHDLRHNRAFSLLNATRDLSKVKQLLGHVRLSTTADYYMHLEIESLRDALNGDARPEKRQANSRPKSRPKVVVNKKS